MVSEPPVSYIRLRAQSTQFRWEVKVQDRVGRFYRSLILTTILIMWLIPTTGVGQQLSVEKKQLVTSLQYGFSFSCPENWTVDRGHVADPLPDLEAFKAGNVAIEGGLGKPAQGEENGVRLNAVKPTRDGGDLPPPTIEVSAHPSAEKSCDQFATEIQEWMKIFGQKLRSAKKIITKNNLEGCDVVYSTSMGQHEVFSRMTAFFKNGRRYILTYFEPNEADFRANAKAFEDVLHSFAITR